MATGEYIDSIKTSDGTSHAIKDTTSGYQTAADVAAAIASKADLIDGKIPSSQLPAFVDDVLTYASVSAFPATGETGKIYIAEDTNKTYRWSGSAYTEISASIALGETSSTAYRGDRGKIAYNHSQNSTVHVTANDKSTWNGKQDAISDLATIRSGASAGATAIQPNDNVSSLTNDAGYLTSYTETDPVFTESAAYGITSSNITAWNNKSDFSGSYSDLTNKPTIPSAGTATPLMDGTAAVGTATKYAREDHKHPSDTAKVTKAGDTMTGTLTLKANQYYDQNTVSGLNANNSDITGVNGIFTADKADDGREGINFYRDATHWDSLYATDGAVYFAPNRPKGSAAGTEGNQKLYAMPNYGNGTTDISIRPLIAFARANRLAFLPADQIIIEKTTDGGTTWQDAGVSDATKKALFATRGASVSIPLLNNAKSTSCGVRITITAMKYAVPSGTAETGKYAYWNSTYVTAQERYSNLRELWFWLSSNNDTIRVQVFYATGANPDSWVSAFNTDFGLTGWSGSDWVRLGGQTFGGSKTQTGNYWNWRIIFWSRMKDGATEFSSATAQSIYGIQGYGDSVWGSSNGMMKEDSLYTWDVDQNATFPANVTATQFNGNLNGNANSATTATKATQDQSGNNIKASYGASLNISGTTLSLKNKNGTALNSVTIPSELPAATSSDSGKFLTTNGSTVSWASVSDNSLPSQSGNSGKFLTTNGSAASWAVVPDEIYQGATAPASPVEGDLWIDTSVSITANRYMPAGGTTNQVLAKSSNTDYNVAWTNISSLGVVPTTRTINGKNLGSNITLSASDVGAAVEIKISSFNPNNFEWDSDTHSSDTDGIFPYRCTIPAFGATSSMVAEVTFGITSAMSGLYAPITECGNDVVYIWASDQTNPTILSILLHK